ncbi:nucleotidyltransferase family protein [Erythrobacter sp.]|jgi:hypothetical protein|uniref:nucleotidyltransferase family protein n=1 Tax=Erythrobacter sp. TaxID=1042 RepID=UPI002ED65C4C
MSDAATIDPFLSETLRALRSGMAPPAFLNEVEHEAYWARIDFHGIAYLLHERREALSDWPQDLGDRIAEEARLLALWEATHHKTVAQVVEALSRAGIDNVILKGTALAYSVHEIPAARRRGDTDLLVEPSALDDARKIFAGLGWERRERPAGIYHQESWQTGTPGVFEHTIDLHWQVVDRPFLQRLLPSSAAWRDRAALTRFSEHAQRPDIATMIIHAVLNQAMHEQNGYFAEAGRMRGKLRLIWSVDLALLAEKCEGGGRDRLLHDCRERGISPMIGQALAMAGEVGAPTSLQALVDELESAPLAPEVADFFTSQDTIGHFLADLRAASGIATKARLITARAIPSRRHLVGKYPLSRSWPTVLLRLRHLVELARRLVQRGGLR